MTFLTREGASEFINYAKPLLDDGKAFLHDLAGIKVSWFSLYSSEVDGEWTRLYLFQKEGSRMWQVNCERFAKGSLKSGEKPLIIGLSQLVEEDSTG